MGFENKLWAVADKLRGHMDASEYKHVVLGLIFLKYISDTLHEKYKTLALSHTGAGKTIENDCDNAFMRMLQKVVVQG